MLEYFFNVSSLKRRFLSATIGLFLFGVSSVSMVHATTIINFDSISTQSGSYDFIGTTYKESGYTIAGTHPTYSSYAELAFWGTDSANYTGSTSLFNWYSNGTSTITNDGGNTFTLNSIQLASLYEYYSHSGNYSVLFTGEKSDGSFVTNTFELANSLSPTTLNFANFTDLKSVAFSQGSTYDSIFQYDNIVLDSSPAHEPVPEPSTVALLGLGLAGVAFMRRRNKK